MFRRLIHRLWSSSVGWSFAVTALRAGGFLLVLPIALRVLPPDELGLWYLFVALGEFCTFAELGLGPVIGRIGSFFMGGVAEIPRHGLQVDAPRPGETAPNLAGLRGLLALARRVYGRIALSVVFFLATAGVSIVWGKLNSMGSADRGNLLMAFGIYALASALATAGLYWPHFLAGLGQVRLSQRALLAGLVANYSVSALGLLAGLGLLSLALGQLALAGTTFFMARAFSYASQPALKEVQPIRVTLGDLWPATWRSLALSFGSYLTNYGLILVCGIVCDLATTASFGVAFRLAAMLHGVSAVWLNVRLPGIATARAAGQRGNARHLALTALPRGLLTYFMGAGLLWLAGAYLLHLVGSRTSLPPQPQFAALLLVLGLDFFVGFHSAAIQTANRFPHLPAYLGGGLVAMALAAGFGHFHGLPGLLAGPLLVHSLFLAWWVPRCCWRELRT